MTCRAPPDRQPTASGFPFASRSTTGKKRRDKRGRLPAAHRNKSILRRFQLTADDMGIDDFVVDDTLQQMREYADACSKLDVSFEVKMDRRTKPQLDNLVSPEFLQVSQQIAEVKEDTAAIRADMATKDDIREIKELLTVKR